MAEELRAARPRGRRLLILLDRLAELSAFVGMLALLFISLAVTVNVLLRWLFAYPINGLNDLTSLATIIAISAALPLCLAHQGNIKVDLAGKALGRREARVLDSFGALVLLLVVAGMAWQLSIFANGKMAAGETTWLLGWPVAPWWWAAVSWFWLSVLCQIGVVVRLALGIEARAHD